MARLSLRRSLLRILFLSISIFIILATITATTNMTNNSDNVSSLEKIVNTLDYAVWISVALSVLFGGLLLIFKSRLNAAQKEENAAMQLQIADANERAHHAEAQIQDAVARAESAIARQKAIEQTNLTLSIQLEKLKLASGDRFVPETLRQSLIPELSKYPRKRVRIEVTGATDEPETFAENLKSVFSSAGWQTYLEHNTAISVPMPTGMRVVAIGKENRAISEFVFNAFKSLGYKCFLDEANSGDLDLWIGIAPK